MKFSKKIVSFAMAVIMTAAFSANTFKAEASSASNNRTVSAVMGGTTVSVKVDATAYFTDYSNYSTGSSISLSFSNRVNVDNISTSGSYGQTSGSTAYVKRSFTVDHNNYYASAVVTGTCITNTNGSRSVSVSIPNLGTVAHY